jgi:predicted phage terminase large subunit-like protein
MARRCRDCRRSDQRARSTQPPAARIGSWDFAAQHDQQALPTSGGIFKREWFKFYRRDALPQVCNQQVQSWDLAFKKKEDSDFVVGQVWERYGANYYLRAERRGRMGFADSKKAVRDLSRAWPDATAKLIESKANGPALVEELRNEIPGLIAVENNDGVREHAWAIQPLVEAGNVFLPDPSEWLEVDDWLDEVCGFPRAGHDDRVAAFTQAVLRMKRGSHLSLVVDPPGEMSEAVRVANSFTTANASLVVNEKF